jgi:hypothetical protein
MGNKIGDAGGASSLHAARPPDSDPPEGDRTRAPAPGAGLPGMPSDITRRIAQGLPVRDQSALSQANRHLRAELQPVLASRHLADRLQLRAPLGSVPVDELLDERVLGDIRSLPVDLQSGLLQHMRQEHWQAILRKAGPDRLATFRDAFDAIEQLAPANRVKPITELTRAALHELPGDDPPEPLRRLLAGLRAFDDRCHGTVLQRAASAIDPRLPQASRRAMFSSLIKAASELPADRQPVTLQLLIVQICGFASTDRSAAFAQASEAVDRLPAEYQIRPLRRLATVVPALAPTRRMEAITGLADRYFRCLARGEAIDGGGIRAALEELPRAASALPPAERGKGIDTLLDLTPVLTPVQRVTLLKGLARVIATLPLVTNDAQRQALVSIFEQARDLPHDHRARVADALELESLRWQPDISTHATAFIAALRGAAQSP